MEAPIFVSPYVLWISVTAMIGLWLVVARTISDSSEDPPPPPFSELNDLIVRRGRPLPDPLVGKFSSSEKADGVEYDVDKGDIWVKDAVCPERVPVDATVVRALLTRLNGAENVEGVEATLVPNVSEFYSEDGSPMPLNRESVTVSWDFYIKSNPDKPFSSSATFKNVKPQ